MNQLIFDPNRGNIEFRYKWIGGKLYVQKIVYDIYERETVSTAPVLQWVLSVDESSTSHVEILNGNLLVVVMGGGITIKIFFIIGCDDAEPITSDKIVFLRDIMGDIRKKYSKKKRWNAKVKKLEVKKEEVKKPGRVQRSLLVTVTHKKLHEKPIIEEEKSLQVTVTPNYEASKYFLEGSLVKITELL